MESLSAGAGSLSDKSQMRTKNGGQSTQKEPTTTNEQRRYHVRSLVIGDATCTKRPRKWVYYHGDKCQQAVCLVNRDALTFMIPRWRHAIASTGRPKDQERPASVKVWAIIRVILQFQNFSTLSSISNVNDTLIFAITS
jgi:hypothetical protein